MIEALVQPLDVVRYVTNHARFPVTLTMIVRIGRPSAGKVLLKIRQSLFPRLSLLFLNRDEQGLVFELISD